MAVTLTIAGQAYPFPTDGEDAWGNNVTNWAIAVSTQLLQRTGGTFSLTGEVDFGASFGLKSLYYKSRATNPSTAGVLRLGNTDSIGFRNAANSANLLLAVNSSNELTFNGVPISTPALTANRAMITNGLGTPTVSSVTATELTYLSGLAIYNVKAFGATGDGVTDDTEAIQDAMDAADGAVLFFPKGTYLVSSQATAWGSTNRALLYGGTEGLVIRGEGAQSILTLSTHEQATIMLLLNGGQGNVLVENMAFNVPARVNTTHQGPYAISVGEIGDTSESGTLDSLTVSQCFCENVSFFVHGEGSKVFQVWNNRVKIQGGGLYPTYFAEAINVSSTPSDTYEIALLEVVNNHFTMDPTYGDHVVYSLGPVEKLQISNNYIDVASTNSTFKLDFNTGTPVYGSVIVEGNYVAAHPSDSEGFLALVGAGTADLLRVVGNTAITPAYLVLCEWHINDAAVENNVARSTKLYGAQFEKNTSLSVLGTLVVQGNDFDNYNTLYASSPQIAIKSNSALYASILYNNLREANVAASYAIQVDYQTWATVEGNSSSTKNLQDVGRDKIVEFGNSWNQALLQQSSAPSTGTFKKGDIAWNNSPDEGEPSGWVCTTAGSPGTWTPMAPLRSAGFLNADIGSAAAIAYSKLAALTTSRALVSDGSGFVSPSSVTSTQLTFLGLAVTEVSPTIVGFITDSLEAARLTKPALSTDFAAFQVNGAQGGYGSGLGMYSFLGTSGAAKEMARIHAYGEAAWDSGSSASQRAGLHFSVCNNGTLTEALNFNYVGIATFASQARFPSLGVGNSASATTLGAVVRKVEIFDASGNSLGFAALYDSIT